MAYTVKMTGLILFIMVLLIVHALVPPVFAIVTKLFLLYVDAFWWVLALPVRAVKFLLKCAHLILH
jgi:hypothetical protein